MKFDTPATTNPIDQLRVVGQPLDRIDGPAKTTGTAPYAYEWQGVTAAPAYAAVLGAGIACGTIDSLDTARAEQASGVLAVVTYRNAGELKKSGRNTAALLAGPNVQHYHQAVAVVVAKTFEQARAAAALIDVTYTSQPGRFDLHAEYEKGEAPDDVTGSPSDSAVGDFETAFGKAPVKVDVTYTTPDQSHAMMEPHATLADWDENGHLRVWTATQMVEWIHQDLAKTLGLQPDQVHVVSPYIGGGFGGKLFLRADAVLAALASRACGTPVKLALPRPLIMNNTTHRAATRQRVRIGTDTDGRIQAIAHQTWSGDLPGGQVEGGSLQTRLLYAGEHRMTAHRLTELDLPEANAMRAPGEAPGLMVLESVMDELAHTLDMDPIALRILNDTQVDPEHPERPFTQRALITCLTEGAARFGWEARQARPAQVREGEWLIGMGVAAAFRNNIVSPSAARVELTSDGRIVVETDMTDIGTGSYTIIGQTAAEMMGVTLDAVTVRLGESRFPVSSGSGGQWGANSSTAGVYAACVRLREALAERVGADPQKVQLLDGELVWPEGRRTLRELAADGPIQAEDKMRYGDLQERFQHSTFGAHFVEVAVNVHTGEPRIRRMLAVCAAGRILNPKTARSQVLGGMAMGAGAALMERLDVDLERGFFVNHDLAGYEVPVHADIPHQDVIFLDETDPYSSPMKAKGVGELGICGVGAAVANAIYNATGVRVRDYPLTLDKLLDGLDAHA